MQRLLLWKALWLHTKEGIWYCELWHLKHYLFWSSADWPDLYSKSSIICDVSLVKSLIQAERSWNDDSEFFSSPFDSIIMSKSLSAVVSLCCSSLAVIFLHLRVAVGTFSSSSWFFFRSFRLLYYLVYKFRVVSAFLMIVYNKTEYSFRNALALHHLSRALLN